MPMTQRDFEAIAEAVAEAKRTVEWQNHDNIFTSGEYAGALRALYWATQELATACAKQYKGAYGFKRQKFVEACGFGDA